jgi:Family of unknown function (DUF6519)/IPT/TIG domain
MAVITSTTFDPLKTRCNVRLQQGVPIVDADWNELDDVRKFELRAYLKWFVGDGIPSGSDGFRIDPAAPPAADDLIIRTGVAAGPAGTVDYDLALRYSGRAIVDGLDVIIPADTNYKAQPLFAAAAHGLPQIAPIPNGAGTIAVYLDVWERLVTATEDPTLILPGIGTESCARMKREWCVRTRTGNTVPQSTDADYIAGHSYYLLSVITRPTAGAVITSSMLQDMRHTKLALTTLESRVALLEKLLLTPTFNASPNQFNPKFGAPGTVITLLGNALNLPPVSVQFGANAATIFGTPSSNLLQVTVPTVAAQTVAITVTTGGGTATSVDTFQILAPAPTFAASPNQFNPKLGAPGVSVTLFGNNFNITPVAVLFGTTPAALVGSPTATQITASVPNMALGATTITVQTGGGQVTSTDTFTVT